MFMTKSIFISSFITLLACFSKIFCAELISLKAFEQNFSTPQLVCFEHLEMKNNILEGEHPFIINDRFLGIDDWSSTQYLDLKKSIISYFNTIDLNERTPLVYEIESFFIRDKKALSFLDIRKEFLVTLFSFLYEYDTDQAKQFLFYYKKTIAMFADENKLDVLKQFHLLFCNRYKDKLFEILLHMYAFFENDIQKDFSYNPLCLSSSDTSSTQSVLTSVSTSADKIGSKHAHSKHFLESANKYTSFLKAVYTISSAYLETVLSDILITLEQCGSTYIQNYDALISFFVKKHKKFAAFEPGEVKDKNKMFQDNIKIIKNFCHFSTVDELIFEAALNLTLKEIICRKTLFLKIRTILKCILLKPNEQVFLIYALIHIEPKNYDDFQRSLIQLEKKDELDVFIRYVAKKRSEWSSFCFEDFIESITPAQPIRESIPQKKKIKIDIKKADPDSFKSSISLNQEEKERACHPMGESNLIIPIQQTTEEKMKVFFDAEINAFKNYHQKQQMKQSSFFSCFAHSLDNDKMLEKYIKKSIFLKLNPSYLEAFKEKASQFFL